MAPDQLSQRWLEANRANWNERAAVHAACDVSGYQAQKFIDDVSFLCGRLHRHSETTSSTRSPL
ncbi:hypothetical protein A5784_04355 [Mycobacterium sp. 852013-50091_SCH5140682]|nr:hypothetical protein A5784_04355 [Mycobacterium sp. 852013-50091_SCH5140682]